ncbi:hypothetical protein [Microbacterium sp. CJ77]|nr:hypothetical protein [Microbacterium sp. CJ77]
MSGIAPVVGAALEGDPQESWGSPEEALMRGPTIVDTSDTSDTDGTMP